MTAKTTCVVELGTTKDILQCYDVSFCNAKVRKLVSLKEIE